MPTKAQLEVELILTKESLERLKAPMVGLGHHRPLTEEEAESVVEWFRVNVGLSAWTINLHLDRCPFQMPVPGTDTDDYHGLSASIIEEHKCSIWLNPEPKNEDPTASLMHELLHGALAEIGISTKDSHEYLITCLGRVLARQYRHDG